MVTISVVMPVHNGASQLGATLDSILGQTERDFECIVVDDGSTDATAKILAAYAARDPRMRIIRQENAGLTRALIVGCAAARGRYIARHDAGDLSHPRRFEIQKQALDADTSIVFVSCSTQIAGPELEPLHVARSTGAALQAAFVLDDSAGALVDGPTHHGSVMFRRDAYERSGGYRPEFYYGQDFDLWYRLAEIGRFQAIDCILYTARITPDSITGNARAQQQQLAKLSLAAVRARQRGEADRPLLEAASRIGPVRSNRRSSQARGLYFIGEALRRNGDGRGRNYLRSAIASDPLLLRAWVRLTQSLLSCLPMSHSIASLNRVHRWLARSRLVTRTALLLRNQCRAVIKYRLMTTHEVHESGEQWLAQRISASCHTVVDVGANRGEWSRMFLRHAPAVERAILFEPGARAAQILRDSFGQEGKVQIIEAALSDRQEEEQRFFEEPEAGNTSSLSRGAATAAAIETRVRVSTLDVECARLGIAQIDLLKIDAEGSDLAVLRGAAGLLRSARIRVVQWEYSDSWAPGGGTLSAALDFLGEAGYRSYLLKNDGIYRFDYRVWGEFFTYANFVSFAANDASLPGPLKELL